MGVSYYSSSIVPFIIPFVTYVYGISTYGGFLKWGTPGTSILIWSFIINHPTIGAPPCICHHSPMKYHNYPIESLLMMVKSLLMMLQKPKFASKVPICNPTCPTFLKDFNTFKPHLSRACEFRGLLGRVPAGPLPLMPQIQLQPPRRCTKQPWGLGTVAP